MFWPFNKKQKRHDIIFQEIDRMCCESIGSDKGPVAAMTAIETTKYLEEKGAFSIDELLDIYERSRLSHRDIALSFIDGAASHLKNPFGMSQERLSFDQKKLLNENLMLLEAVIDAVMRKNPGKILPRNGRFAEAAEKAGMDKWTKRIE